MFNKFVNQLLLGTSSDHRRFYYVNVENIIHALIVGETGAGKSELMKSMIVQCMLRDDLNVKNVILIDPHGQLAKEVLKIVSKYGNIYIYYINPYTFITHDRGFITNPFMVKDENDESIVAIITESFVSTFKKLYDEYWGPVLESTLRNAIQLILAFNKIGRNDLCNISTLIRLIGSAEDREEILKMLRGHISNDLYTFWSSTFPTIYRQESARSSLNKLDKLMKIPFIARMFSLDKAKDKDIILDFDLLLQKEEDNSNNETTNTNNKNLIIIDLSACITDDITNFLGSMMLHNIYVTLKRRLSKLIYTSTNRSKTFIFIDEAHRFELDVIRDFLDTMRKLNVSVIIATQTLTNMKEVAKDIHALFNTIIVFKTGQSSIKHALEYVIPSSDSILANIKTYILQLPAHYFIFYNSTRRVIGAMQTMKIDNMLEHLSKSNLIPHYDTLTDDDLSVIINKIFDRCEGRLPTIATIKHMYTTQADTNTITTTTITPTTTTTTPTTSFNQPSLLPIDILVMKALRKHAMNAKEVSEEVYNMIKSYQQYSLPSSSSTTVSTILQILEGYENLHLYYSTKAISVNNIEPDMHTHMHMIDYVDVMAHVKDSLNVLYNQFKYIQTVDSDYNYNGDENDNEWAIYALTDIARYKYFYPTFRGARVGKHEHINAIKSVYEYLITNTMLFPLLDDGSEYIKKVKADKRRIYPDLMVFIPRSLTEWHEIPIAIEFEFSTTYDSEHIYNSYYKNVELGADKHVIFIAKDEEGAERIVKALHDVEFSVFIYRQQEQQPQTLPINNNDGNDMDITDTAILTLPHISDEDIKTLHELIRLIGSKSADNIYLTVPPQHDKDRATWIKSKLEALSSKGILIPIQREKRKTSVDAKGRYRKRYTHGTTYMLNPQIRLTSIFDLIREGIEEIDEGEEYEVMKSREENNNNNKNNDNNNNNKKKKKEEKENHEEVIDREDDINTVEKLDQLLDIAKKLGYNTIDELKSVYLDSILNNNKTKQYQIEGLFNLYGMKIKAKKKRILGDVRYVIEIN